VPRSCCPTKLRICAQRYSNVVIMVQVKLIEQEYMIRQEVCREFGEQLIEIEERHRCGEGREGRVLSRILILGCWAWVPWA